MHFRNLPCGLPYTLSIGMPRRMLSRNQAAPRLRGQRVNRHQNNAQSSSMLSAKIPSTRKVIPDVGAPRSASAVIGVQENTWHLPFVRMSEGRTALVDPNIHIAQAIDTAVRRRQSAGRHLNLQSPVRDRPWRVYD
jgi:hypothetical protein